MKTLLVFTENYARGGGNRYMADMINSVSGLYNRLTVVANPGGIFQEDIDRIGGNVVFSEFFFLTKPRILHALPEYLKTLAGPLLTIAEPLFFILNTIIFIFYIRRAGAKAVLCCNGGFPAARSTLAMSVASRLSGVPVLLSIVSMPMARRKWLGVYEKAIDTIVWRSVTGVIVNARSIAASLEALRGMPLKKAHILYNGIEKSPQPSRPDIDGAAVIGCVARMDRAKGVLFLFEAFRELAAIHADIKLVLAGKGDASDELARLVREAKLEGRVELTGFFKGDVQELLASFSIYVFPSLHEGFPYSILEAMRAACAIVSTNVGGIPEAITNGRNGMLVEPGSSRALTDAIERLIKDPALRIRLGQNGRRRFEKEFSLEPMHRKCQEIFKATGMTSR